MYLHLYMDDVLIASKYNYEIDVPKHMLNNMFEIKDLGSTKKNLRTEVIKNRAPSTFLLSQERYIKKVLESLTCMITKLLLTLIGTQFKLSIT